MIVSPPPPTLRTDLGLDEPAEELLVRGREVILVTHLDPGFPQHPDRFGEGEHEAVGRGEKHVGEGEGVRKGGERDKRHRNPNPASKSRKTIIVIFQGLLYF